MTNILYMIIIYPLIQLIEFSFELFNALFKNSGISVIGVSLAVTICCLPLYIVAERWQQLERDTEKKLQPGVKQIKNSFKGDEQYMMLSTYYKQHQYHPVMALRSSFGLLIQIPFFIAAYIFLSELPELQGTHFLFIRDMGKPDALFSIGNFSINILPIAMTVINIIAGAIYTKGFPVKEKVQIYAMAIIFLVILYTSPSGLVLYWTMNNVFSLIKNIFYKLKNPLKVLYLLMCLAILGTDYYLIFIHEGLLSKRLLMIVVISLLLLLPLAVKGFKYLLTTLFEPLVVAQRKRTGLFIITCLSLCLLVGFVIPSYVINSSVQEFSNIDSYGNPLYFLHISLLQSFGLFVFWPLCIYLLFHDRIQTIFTLAGLAALIFSLIDAFGFSGNYGTLSRLMTFTASITAADSTKAIAMNILALVVAAAVVVLLFKFRRQSVISAFVAIILTAEFGITVIHGIEIGQSYKKYQASISDSVKEADFIKPVYHLSKTGKNVVIFMLDRAENAYVEPIFDTYPELYDDFSGFTLYRNTVSFGGWTLTGSPGLYGGYEYTPAQSNKVENKQLVEKQNEALLTMPRIFSETAGYSATVSDLSWANFSWIPDMRICDKYPDITGLNVERKYSGLWIKQNLDKIKPNMTSTAIKRNLIWFSFFKTVPLFMRNGIYDDGHWWASDSKTSDIMEFLDYYSGLAFLPQLTDFQAKKQNTFTCIVNEVTHSDQELQSPDFNLSLHVTDKGPCPISNAEGFCGNVTAYKLLAKWIQMLKDNGVYDNTRIILVSDHGIGSDTGKKLDFGSSWNLPFNPDHFHPLLMVKDFNSSGKMKTSDEFMTNADVPTIALKGIIENPVNPFTGNLITDEIKHGNTAPGVVIAHDWQPLANSLYKYTVPDSDWYTVRNNIFKVENWQKGIEK